MILEVNRVITLGNNEQYLIIEEVEKYGKEYYYIAEINKTKKYIKDNYKIITTTEEDEEIYIEEITGEDKLKEILPLFLEKFSKPR